MQNKFIFALMCLATPAVAEFEPPVGCAVYMTVQSKMCSVSHHYTCENDPAGHQWRADIDERGPSYVGQIDGETRWIKSYDLINGDVTHLDEDGSADHASFTTLARENRDEFDFYTVSDTGEVLQITGYDRLTGKTVIIDDIPLLETENDVTATRDDGTVRWHAKGNEYISLEHRMFLSGPSAIRWVDGNLLIDRSPLEFIFPGENGFRSEVPKYDCESTMSNLHIPGLKRASYQLNTSDLGDSE
ncbi:MAG: hypothetical protein ACPGRD_03480 [Planktomarina sp.]